MGKPYFAYNNLLPSATVSARTEDSNYPASNLTKHRLWPGYRSADRHLVLNGSSQLLWHTDTAALSITDDLTMVIVAEPHAVGSYSSLVSKLIGSSVTGFAAYRIGATLRVYLGGTANYVQTTGNVFSTASPSALKAVFDSSVPELSIWDLNAKVEVARANNSTQTGCTLSGTIPSTLGDNTVRLTLGGNASGGELYDGGLALVALATAEWDNAFWPAATSCAGYWDFSADDLTDSSGNGHILTGQNLNSGCWQDFTGWQWVYCGFSAAPAPSLLFIDRRHNLSTGAVVRVSRGGPTSWWEQACSATVTASEAVCADLTGAATQHWWMEIHDPDNTDGYIEIPYIYLGDKTSMSRGFLRGYRHSQKRHGSVLADSAGGYTSYVRSEQLWEADIRFRALSADFSTLEAVSDVASLMQPVVFSEDGTDAKTRLVYWIDAMSPAYSHNVDTQNFVDLQLRECGGGL